MSLSDVIKKIPVLVEEVTVAGVTFVVSGMSDADRAAMAASCRKKDGTLNGDMLDLKMLEQCVTLKEDGSSATADEWAQAQSHVTGPLKSCAISLLGFDKDDIKRVRRDPKDSGSTQS